MHVYLDNSKLFHSKLNHTLAFQQIINHFCIIFPIYCWSLADEGHLVLFQYQWIIDKLISNVKYGFVCHLYD